MLYESMDLYNVEKSLKSLNHTTFASYTVDSNNVESQHCKNPWICITLIQHCINLIHTMLINIVQIQFIQCWISMLYESDSYKVESQCCTIQHYTIPYWLKGCIIQRWYCTSLLHTLLKINVVQSHMVSYNIQHCTILPRTTSTLYEVPLYPVNVSLVPQE